MADRRDREADESRRILERVAHEDTTFVGRTAKRVHDHVTAADADRDDWAEYWGTRIGRIGAILVVIAMIAYLVHFLATSA